MWNSRNGHASAQLHFGRGRFAGDRASVDRAGQTGGGEGGQPAAPGASATPSRRSTSYTQTGNGSLSSSTSEAQRPALVAVAARLIFPKNFPLNRGHDSESGCDRQREDHRRQRANTIIMLGNQEIVVKVQKILDEMDVKAPQVALSTVIGELTLNNDEEFGIDYFAKYNGRVVGTSRNTGVTIPNSVGISGSTE
jgi:type II secretory pathway component GspD/PulD (secretin)